MAKQKSSKNHVYILQDMYNPLPLPDLVYIIGDLDKGLNFHQSFFLVENF